MVNAELDTVVAMRIGWILYTIAVVLFTCAAHGFQGKLIVLALGCLFASGVWASIHANG